MFVVAIVVVPVTVARDSKSPAPVIGQTSARLGSVGSNRYAYWKVAVRAGLAPPAGGRRGERLRRPSGCATGTIDDAAHDAHSLEIETFAELGLIGLALLAATFAGVFMSGARGVSAPIPRWSPARAPRWPCGRCTARSTGTGRCPR